MTEKKILNFFEFGFVILFFGMILFFILPFLFSTPVSKTSFKKKDPMITIAVEGEAIFFQKVRLKKGVEFQEISKHLVLHPDTDLKRFSQKERYDHDCSLFLPLKRK